MRTKNSMINMSISILSQIITVFLGFVSRKVFIDSLGTEYLGLNGFLTNVLSLLGLVEGGIGTSIVYNLYKPLADKDEEKVIALVQLYKKLYFYIAIGVVALSLCLYPFLGIFIKDGKSLEYVPLVYSIFVIKNVISYFNAHKWSLINADQKGYVLARINIIFNVVTTITKIVILKTTKNYILFLLIDILIFIIQNIYNGRIVNKRYSYINTKKKYKVDKEIENNLVKNVKALFWHNIGGYCVYGTDNILISSLISIKTVGLYSNYTMIIDQLGNLINPIINSIGDGVGNMIASEDSDKSYRIFKVAYLVNFWIYSFAVIFLYNLVEPFITWCFGSGLLLDKLTFVIVLINFYIKGLRGSIAIFKNKGGIFTQDKYVPMIESVINLGSSLVLIKYLGLAGIFLGTTISSIAIPLWNRPRLVYKHIFNKHFKEYMYRYAVYVLLTLVTGIFTSYFASLFNKISFGSLVIKGIICVIIPNGIYLGIFYKTEEFKYLLGIINPISIKIKSKLKI
ncbi:TPA: lipopolysaccharide biosynthesis protein [Clostridium perfringens]|nr:hypothetical protein [Clostridium perfringens]EJT6483909.1 hypothetical protein [Clostridium perfringens]ELC8434903.1 hypothetical protein [Clostridium perfringens]MDU4221824.1 hypothetical protein [Clostridium perfringens]BDA23151.1 sugar translocase [Clostridium perfringens]